MEVKGESERRWEIEEKSAMIKFLRGRKREKLNID